MWATRISSEGIGRLLLVLMLTAGCAQLPGSATIDLGSRQTRYALIGEGQPVVVFESGLGDGRSSWSPVFESVGRMTRAFAYDRLGYSGSRGSEEARDGATIVAELRETLHALGLPPPYVLVGHSFGGPLVELFARLHPSEVAGVVFVDARHVDFGERCEASGANDCGLPWIAGLLMPAAARRELEALPRTEEEVRTAGRFPDVPLRVLTGTRRPGRSSELRATWLETQSDLAELSPRGRHEICEPCGHYVHRDAPELVVEAIGSLVEATRESRIEATRELRIEATRELRIEATRESRIEAPRESRIEAPRESRIEAPRESRRVRLSGRRLPDGIRGRSASSNRVGDTSGGAAILGPDLAQ